MQLKYYAIRTSIVVIAFSVDAFVTATLVPSIANVTSLRVSRISIHRYGSGVHSLIRRLPAVHDSLKPPLMMASVLECVEAALVKTARAPTKNRSRYSWLLGPDYGYQELLRGCIFKYFTLTGIDAGSPET